MIKDIIDAIQETPLPTIIIFAGLFFLFLGFVNKIGGFIEISSEQRRWTIPIGLLLLTVGLVLYFVPPQNFTRSELTQESQTSKREEIINPQLSQIPFQPVGDYTIKAIHSEKCLEVSNASEENGSNIVQDDCNNQPNQTFSFKPRSNGEYSMIAKHSNKCLDVKDDSKENGINIVQYDCNNQLNQTFSFRPQGNSTYQIIASHSNKCFDVAEESRDNNAEVIQYDCVNADGLAPQNRSFRFVSKTPQ